MNKYKGDTFFPAMRRLTIGVLYLAGALVGALVYGALFMVPLYLLFSLLT